MSDALRPALEQGAAAGLRYRLLLPDDVLRGGVGERLGQRAGSSLDFHEYRDYQSGDDLRRIDWGVYARSDRLTVKLFREEVTPHLDLVLDGSRSMDLPGTAKARAATGLAALLAQAARNAQCSAQVWTQRRGFERLGHGHLHPTAWEVPSFTHDQSPAEAIEQLAPACRSRSLRVFVSDLLFPADPVRVTRRLARDAAGLHVVQLLARADAQPPEPGNLRLEDAEGGGTLDLYLDTTRQAQYRQRLAAHQDAWRGACRSHGARLHVVVAEDIVPGWTLDPLVADGLLLGS